MEESVEESAMSAEQAQGSRQRKAGRGRKRERDLIAGIIAAVAVSFALLGVMFYVVYSRSNQPPQTAIERDVVTAEAQARNSPKSAAAQLAAGWADLAAEEYDGALSYADKALKIDAGSVDALILKGVVKEAQGDLADARAILLQAGEAKKGGSVEAYSRLAALEQRQGDLDLAQKYLTEAATLAPTDAQLKIQLARLNSEIGDDEAARQNLLDAMRYVPDMPELRDELAALAYGPADYDLARLAFADGNLEEADTLMHLAIEHSPEVAWLHVALGDYLLDIKKDPAGAEQAYKKALEIDPENQEARAALEAL
jgi:tetratricopeptide (TPR) repeat protein